METTKPQLSVIIGFDQAAENVKKKREERSFRFYDAIERMTKDFEDGKINEWVAIALDTNCNPTVYYNTMDLASTIGIFDIGKHKMLKSCSEDW